MLWRAQWHEGPLRMTVPVLAIALGIALAAAVYFVNHSALEEFEQAARRLAGEADLVVRGPSEGFAEDLYPQIAKLEGVAVASPVLAIDVSLPGAPRPLPVIALDPFRATRVQPGLLGEIAGGLRGFFEPDGIFLSMRAADALEAGTGDRFEVLVGNAPRSVRVLGLLSDTAYPQALGIMDIAAAQWMFGRLGRLTRIDIRLVRGAALADVHSSIELLLPAGVTVAAPAIDSDRLASATRAYRVNLSMLALVAVLTGAFLVLATQSLAILRRRPALALLRALGVTRGGLERALIAEGVVLGLIGAALGVALGLLVARWAMRVLAGDLGAGQLAGATGSLAVQPLEMLAFVAAGSVFAGLGAWLPAREAAARSPALALKSGDAQAGVGTTRPWRAGLILMGLGGVLALLPAIQGVPLFGYGAVALLLTGAVLLVPDVAERLLGSVPAMRRAPLALAVAQLRGSTAQVSIGLVAIIASFSLMVAMAIMVHSFRESFVAWLDTVVPADMQLRVGQVGSTATLTETDEIAVSRIEGVARSEFRRVLPLALRRGAVPVALIAMPIDEASAAERLVLVKAVRGRGPSQLPPVWVSEAMVDLYGWGPGTEVVLPLAGGDLAARVAGAYRDYGRSGGSIVIPRKVYASASGDSAVNEGSLWLARTADAAAVEAAIRARAPFGEALQIRTAAEVRDISLRNFDRAFAITYALEAIAVFIGLLGVSVAAASTALARRAEFGMLRHIGLRRRQVVTMLAAEGVLTSAIGVCFALLLGGLLSLVLVYVINRQSFLWSIDLAVPWLALAVLAATLLIAAAITATLSGRAALSGDAVRAVREDW
jgi:putative ABC transport system permease protein